jgi:uncharacterized membrane protein
MHAAMAFGVSFALTDSLAFADAIMRVEPLINTGAHDFFDRRRTRREQRAGDMQPALVRSRR